VDKQIKIREGELNARGLRFAIIASYFYPFIVDQLLDAATDTLIRHGADASDIEVIKVPGAFEIPIAAKKLAASNHYDAIVALGCVIRGETTHFDFVAGECSKGIAQVSLDYEIPVGFGVLTVDTAEQALERAQPETKTRNKGNKGIDAALSALEMATLLRRLES